jgi:hypothetical protein
VALLYRERSTFIVRLARVHVSGEIVRLEPIGPLYFRTPPGSSAYRISFSVGDFDGDGPNEFVLLGRERDAAHFFKVPGGELGARATLSHHEWWALPPGTTDLLVPASPPERRAADDRS